MQVLYIESVIRSNIATLELATPIQWLSRASANKRYKYSIFNRNGKIKVKKKRKFHYFSRIKS